MVHSEGRRFEDRRALVTAAGSGIGRGVALRLAREGAAVTVWDRDASLLDDLRAEAPEIAIHALDMTDAQEDLGYEPEYDLEAGFRKYVEALRAGAGLDPLA